MNTSKTRATTLLAAALVATACASGSAGPAATSGASTGGNAGPRIIQPGAPGQGSRDFENAPIEDIEGADYTDADVAFMQGMIHHHAQALRMTALVPDRTSDQAFQSMALRMRISQTDEIRMMQNWLQERGQMAPDPDHAMHLMQMPGMLSQEQMNALAAAEGVDFQRLFLQGMIQHHGGAIVMVQELFNTPGAGQETTINFFANEVDADQTIEIYRMQQMLQTLG